MVPDLRRAQSVLDFCEEDVCFTVSCFAERDDADFIFSLRMNDRNGNAGKQPQCDEALLTVGEPVVCECVGQCFKDARHVNEVEPVGPQVRGPLRF